jgi:hypothetical protein
MCNINFFLNKNQKLGVDSNGSITNLEDQLADIYSCLKGLKLQKGFMEYRSLIYNEISRNLILSKDKKSQFNLDRYQGELSWLNKFFLNMTYKSIDDNF